MLELHTIIEPAFCLIARKPSTNLSIAFHQTQDAYYIEMKPSLFHLSTFIAEQLFTR